MIGKLLLGAVITSTVVAAPAVSACPLGIDAHLTTPRGSPFLAKQTTAVELRMLRAAKLSDLTVTGLPRRTMHRALERADLGTCLTLSPATVTFRVTTAGLVTSVLVASTDPAAIACLWTAIGALRLPASRVESRVDVTITP